MERPALRHLLADIAAHRVDAVVVYKVDRLTRSLSDFARLIEAFENGDVSFVSITQAFNTTTSMGRLTLNVLLSFAQFEREVTGERIRDKIAASKAKGMWMGGSVPLGYDVPTDPTTRALVVNIDEAKTVRLIFNRFLELGNSFALQQWLKTEGVRSKNRVTARGRRTGGLVFSRGALRHLLRNRTYLGEIVHKGQIHPGRHTAILDRQTFEAALAVAEKNSRKRRFRVTHADGCLLKGLVFDGDGQPMVPRFGRQRRKLYQYYASTPVLGATDEDGKEDAIRRVPCSAIDELVIDRASRVLGPLDVASVRTRVRSLIGRVEIHSASVHLVIRVKALPAPASAKSAIHKIRTLLAPGEQVLIDPSNTGLVRILLPTRLVVRGGRSWAIAPDGRSIEIASAPDGGLINRLRKAHSILRDCGLEPETANRTRLLRACAPPSRTQSSEHCEDIDTGPDYDIPPDGYGFGPDPYVPWWGSWPDVSFVPPDGYDHVCYPDTTDTESSPWFKYDLGASHSIDQVIITQTNGNASTAVLEYSTNGTTWTTIAKGRQLVSATCQCFPVLGFPAMA